MSSNRGKRVASSLGSQKMQQMRAKSDGMQKSVRHNLVEECGLSRDRPVFQVLMRRSTVNHPYRMAIPIDARNTLAGGRLEVPTTITRGSRTWKLTWKGSCKVPRFLYSGWKCFVKDNNLKMGDVCMFEVVVATYDEIALKAVILRNGSALHSQRMTSTAEQGTSAETAVDLTGYSSSEQSDETAGDLPGYSSSEQSEDGPFRIGCAAKNSDHADCLDVVCDCPSQDQPMVASPAGTGENAVHVTADEPHGEEA